MRFRAWLRASFSFGLPLLAVADVACSGGGDTSHVSLAPSISFPADTLTGVTSLTLAIYDATGAIDCNATSGQAAGVTPTTPQSISPPPVLNSMGCGTAKFCGTFDLSKSTTARVFAATASGANGIIAYGCAKQVINSDNVSVGIKMLPYVTPAVCGNTTLEFTEQCDPPSAPSGVCDSMCHTVEEYLSVPSTGGTGTVAGGIGDKFRPQFAWPQGIGNHFFAAWGDRSPTPQTQIDVRVLDDTLAQLAPTAINMEAAVASMFIPNGSGLPPTKETGNQFWPAVAYSTGRYYVAYQDDHTAAGNGLDIHLRSMDANTLAADQTPDAPQGINGASNFGQGEPGVQNNPAIAAGPQGDLYVVWQDSSNATQAGGPGAITGRRYSAGGQLQISQYVINGVPPGTGTAENPSVAGTPGGWIVVWDDRSNGGNIFMSVIGSDGSASPSVQVNQAPHNNGVQDHPWIATIPGSPLFAVVWADHGAPGGTDVAFQRFDMNGAPIAGDQNAGDTTVVVNDASVTGEQVSPVIAATGKNGGSYAIAWYDQATMHVKARYLSAITPMPNAFLPNYVNAGGTSNEFQVSLTPNHARANPFVVIGGSGPFVAVGWEDLDASKPGIYARRFPAPPSH